MSNLILICAHCGAQMDYTDMGSTVIVTVERWLPSGTSVERRYLCPTCGEAAMAWLDGNQTAADDDMPLGG